MNCTGFLQDWVVHVSSKTGSWNEYTSGQVYKVNLPGWENLDYKMVTILIASKPFGIVRLGFFFFMQSVFYDLGNVVNHTPDETPVKGNQCNP